MIGIYPLNQQLTEIRKDCHAESRSIDKALLISQSTVYEQKLFKF